MDLGAFFQGKGVELFAEVGIEKLPPADQTGILQFLPMAKSVIVFGKEVPAQVYKGPKREKTREMLRIAEALDRSASLLTSLLNAEQIPARSIPLYLPVRISGGKIQGLVRLKQVAAAGGLGSIGANTLLLTPEFGPRLLLSGVVIGRPVTEWGSGRRSGQGGIMPVQLCTGCGRCTRSCPFGALGPEGVDTFRCRTVSTWIPARLVPVVKWLLGRQVLLTIAAPVAPWIARVATIRCSLCVTECPSFAGDKMI